MLVDEFLPVYDVSDAVATVVQAEVATTWDALMQVGLIEVGRTRPMVGFLGALRALPEVVSHLLHGESPPQAPKRLRLHDTTSFPFGEGGGIYGSDALRFYGGGLSLSSLGLIEVQNSTISNNAANRGTGIYGISLRMTAWNSTFSRNMASEEGGALYIGGTTLGASTTHLTMSTIAKNTAPPGSAVLGAGETPTVRFSGNIVDGDCHATDDAVVWMSQGSNIENPADNCDFGESSDMVNMTSAQLRLDALADNGGETETHLPMMGSVVIDAITAERCTEVLPGSEQRLVSRPQGIGCDVGSVEVVPAP